MTGINPYGYMQQVATELPSMNSREQVEKVLDEMEYLFEVIPPEMQEPADQLISKLRDKLTQLSAD